MLQREPKLNTQDFPSHFLSAVLFRSKLQNMYECFCADELVVLVNFKLVIFVWIFTERVCKSTFVTKYIHGFVWIQIFFI